MISKTVGERTKNRWLICPVTSSRLVGHLGSSEVFGETVLLLLMATMFKVEAGQVGRSVKLVASTLSWCHPAKEGFRECPGRPSTDSPLVSLYSHPHSFSVMVQLAREPAFRQQGISGHSS